ncbi:hypothetical protein [Pseudomonas promysalinigenes]|uniref:Uncharacterized protein n=1 Tax=Pseudomonas promysalinigenes TaxID=485898 RepID=A0ABY6AV85_9PSED|nr:hypothetical protein [Pseudomonas promysalinigenes]UXH41603.1 hypothetical protein N5C08_08795 [Pseudomonas promysalinigenes]
MTIDKQKLKALAEAARDYSGSDLIEHESRYNALACEVDPVTVLTLLAEIERHEAWRTAFLAERDAQMRQRDQLRAENEALRTDAERYRWLRNPAGTIVVRNVQCHLFGSRMDEQVDAARSASAKPAVECDACPRSSGCVGSCMKVAP